MANTLTYANAANFVSQTWSRKVRSVVPENLLLQRTFPFTKQSTDLSGKYNIVIDSFWPQGGTPAAAGSDGALNSSIVDPPALASVDSPAFTMRYTLTLEMIKRMANERQVQGIVQQRMVNLKKSHESYNEFMTIYGSDPNGFGTVAAVVGDVIRITDAEFAAGNFADRGNAIFDVYNGAAFTGQSVTLRGLTKSNVTPRQLTLATGDGAKVAVGNILRYRGAVPLTTEPLGIKRILTETTTLFGVDIATNPSYQGTRVNVAGPLTFDAWYASLIKVGNFNFDGDCIGLMNPLGFGDMVRQIEGARTFGGNQFNSTLMKRGLQMLQIIGPKGMVELYGHPKMKEGDACILKLDTWESPGVCGVELLKSGLEAQGIGPLWQIPSSNSMEIKTYSQKSTFCGDPQSNLMITGIVNSAAISIGAV